MRLPDSGKNLYRIAHCERIFEVDFWPITALSPSSPLPLLVRADIIRSIISASHFATTSNLEFNRRSNITRQRVLHLSRRYTLSQNVKFAINQQPTSSYKSTASIKSAAFSPTSFRTQTRQIKQPHSHSQHPTSSSKTRPSPTERFETDGKPDAGGRLVRFNRGDSRTGL